MLTPFFPGFSLIWQQFFINFPLLLPNSIPPSPTLLRPLLRGMWFRSRLRLWVFMIPHPANFSFGEKDMAGRGLECRAQARGPRFLRIRILGVMVSPCLYLPPGPPSNCLLLNRLVALSLNSDRDSECLIPWASDTPSTYILYLVSITPARLGLPHTAASPDHWLLLWDFHGGRVILNRMLGSEIHLASGSVRFERCAGILGRK